MTNDKCLKVARHRILIVNSLVDLYKVNDLGKVSKQQILLQIKNVAKKRTFLSAGAFPVAPLLSNQNLLAFMSDGFKLDIKQKRWRVGIPLI